MPDVQQTIHAPAVFLGGLASEVNEPDVLDVTFAVLADVSERVVTALRAGRMGEDDAASCLRVLRLVGLDGHEWALGATTLRWYRKLSSGAWKLATPPAEADERHRNSLVDAINSLPTGIFDVIGPVDVPDPAEYGAHEGPPVAVAPTWDESQMWGGESYMPSL